MHPLVRDLYKRFIIVARDYPNGREFLRKVICPHFAANAHLTSEIDIKKAVKHGRYGVREMKAVIQLKKYREMRRRYGENT